MASSVLPATASPSFSAVPQPLRVPAQAHAAAAGVQNLPRSPQTQPVSLPPAAPAPLPPVHSNITVRAASYRAITVADVQAGDIGFEYKRRHRTFKQNLIHLGERIQNFGRSEFRGSPHVMHAFVVTASEPYADQLMIADAATGDPKNGGTLGINEVSMGFANRPNVFTDLKSHTVFCRFKDPRMQAMLVSMARSWCRPNVDTFSATHAYTAPWRRKHIHAGARRRLQCVLAALKNGQPVPALRGAGPYRAMCSEFVANVGAAAAMALFCEDRGLPYNSPDALQGLANNHAGNVFNCDPRSMVPSALHARMAADPAAEIVGYIPAPLGAD